MHYLCWHGIFNQKTDSANNPEDFPTTKTGIENRRTLYLVEDCMKKVCESLREHAKNITDFEKKKMLSFAKEEFKLHQDAKVCYIWGIRILKKLA